MMSLSIPLTIAITAHRDLVRSETPGIKAAIREFLEDLMDRYPGVPLRLLSPLAEGGGRIAAQVALELELELVVPLPFAAEEYERDFLDAESVSEFRALCAQCEVLEIPGTGGWNLEDIAAGGRARDMQYANLGVFLADQAQLLLAVWDGKTLPLAGGTSQVINYHQFGRMAGTDGRFNRRQSVLAEDDTSLVFHIVCSRDREDGQPAEGLEALETRYLVSDPDQRVVDDIPHAYDLMIRRFRDFNTDQQHLRRLPGPSQLSRSNDQAETESEPNATERLFEIADSLAIHFQVRFYLALRSIYTIGALMGLAFIAFADLGQQSMILVFLGLFTVGFAIHRIGDRAQLHRKYLDYRALAEGLRVQYYWQKAGVSGRTRNDFAYDNFLQKQDIEIGWIRQVMAFAALSSNTKPDDVSIDGAIRDWIGGDNTGGQLDYYRNKASVKLGQSRVTRLLVKLSLWVGIALAVAIYLLGENLSATTSSVMMALMGLFPLVGAVRSAYAHKVAETELIKQFQYMHRLFRDALYKIHQAESISQQQEILRALGEAALDEHAEWILMHRERPLEMGQL